MSVVRPLLIYPFVIFFSAYCFQVIPERTTLTYVNPKYFSNVTLTVRRSSRRGEYVYNIFGTNKVPFGNNATLHVMIFELSKRYNQYLPTFIEFHYKLCDMIHKDQLFGAILRKQGVTDCPVLPGPKAWTNMTLITDIGYEWPFQKGKAESTVRSESAKELTASADVYFSVKRNPKV